MNIAGKYLDSFDETYNLKRFLLIPVWIMTCELYEKNYLYHNVNYLIACRGMHKVYYISG